MWASSLSHVQHCQLHSGVCLGVEITPPSIHPPCSLDCLPCSAGSSFLIFSSNQYSPHAHISNRRPLHACRLFVSNLNARMAQRFLALVLLPHFRGDIQQNKRLHHALFQALRKATYKPDAFYKVFVCVQVSLRLCLDMHHRACSCAHGGCVCAHLGLGG